MLATAGLLVAALSVLLGLAPIWAAMGALLVLDIGCIMLLSKSPDEPREPRPIRLPQSKVRARTVRHVRLPH